MSDENLDRDLVQAWEQGTPAEIKRTRPTTSVLSTRLPLDLFEEISRKAESEGKSVSLFARELFQRFLAKDIPSTPSEVATMFQRWTVEAVFVRSLWAHVATVVPKDSWILVSRSLESLDATQQDLRTEVRTASVPVINSSRAGEGKVA